MFDYTIHKENSPAEFKQACSKIEKAFPAAKKRKLLIDVDGSTIQIFSLGEKSIIVYDDYDVGAVFIKSELDLSDLIS